MSEIKTAFLFVKSEYKWVRIDLANVLYLSGLRDYTQVYIKGKASPVTTLQNLKEFEAKLPTEAFIRIHKSFIVAIAQIDSIGKNEICIGENTLPIGNAYKQALNLVIEKNS